MIKKVSVFILLSILFSTCETIEDYPETPEIEFISFDADYKETPLGSTLYGTLSFSFIDGDGNIGFEENTDDIVDNNITDVIIKEFKANGELIKDTLGPFYLPFFNEGSYRKSLKGKIEINIPRTNESADTAYYEFYIVDRDHKQSNTIVTPVYVYSDLIKQ